MLLVPAIKAYYSGYLYYPGADYYGVVASTLIIGTRAVKARSLAYFTCRKGCPMLLSSTLVLICRYLYCPCFKRSDYQKVCGRNIIQQIHPAAIFACSHCPPAVNSPLLYPSRVALPAMAIPPIKVIWYNSGYR